MMILVLLLVGSVLGRRALVLVDVQRDFFGPNGTFSIPKANAIVSSLNEIRTKYTFHLVVLSKTINCPKQLGFTSRFPGASNFSHIVVNYDKSGNLCSLTKNSSAFPYCADLFASLHQTLFPDYSISGTQGVDIHPDLIQNQNSDVIISRGPTCDLSWYSVFSDNLGFNSTGLDKILRGNGINTIFLGGFGYDTNLYFTAKEAKKLGYEVFLIEDVCAAFVKSSIVGVNMDLLSTGVIIINSLELPSIIELDNSNIVKTVSPSYFTLDSMATWQEASNACYPNRLCTLSEYCPSNSPVNGIFPPGTWAPVSDGINQWVYLGSTTNDTFPYFLTSPTCSLFSNISGFSPAIIQVDNGVSALCCYAQQNLSSSPTPSPSTSPSPPRKHVSVVDDVPDSPNQVNRVILIACLCLGLGVASGMGVGCFLGRKSVVALPNIL